MNRFHDDKFQLRFERGVVDITERSDVDDGLDAIAYHRVHLTNEFDSSGHFVTTLMDAIDRDRHPRVPFRSASGNFHQDIAVDLAVVSGVFFSFETLEAAIGLHTERAHNRSVALDGSRGVGLRSASLAIGQEESSMRRDRNRPFNEGDQKRVELELDR